MRVRLWSSVITGIVLLALLVAMPLLSACGGGEAPSPAPAPAPDAQPADPTPPPAAAPAAAQSAAPAPAPTTAPAPAPAPAPADAPAEDPAPSCPDDRTDLEKDIDRIKKGGDEKYHVKAKQQEKLFARDRLKLLLDPDFLLEDGMFANCLDDKLPADGIVTVVGKIHGRPVAIVANDSTIKAGSWGKRTVEKIIRMQETAAHMRIPLIYLVDSAGARITDQIDMFPGRRGAGKIFYNEANLSGVIPQICCLFGPSAAGGAYIPAFCDVVVMVEGRASMYLGSPRMVEMVIGEETTLEEMRPLP